MISAGDSFGSYKVVRKLGQGGMGEVWLLESASGRKVAAKFLDSASAGDHEARRRFLREAQLAIDVKHPNLVETYDVGEDPDTGLCYILMEYVSGGSLEDYLKKQGALPIADAVAVVEAMAGVLEIARQKGIVHRDIKPANIMFSADGTPKLADLGIARGGSAGTETTTVTQTGVMIGTPAYMAPEQMLDSHNVDTRADIYSLGIVFFEMLTGERPNKDDTVVQLMAKAVKGEPLPDVRTLRPEVSASLAQLLAMMVAPDKEGRISTPGQITNALAVIERGGKFVSRAELERKQREAKHAELLRKQAKKRNLLVVSVVAVFVGLVAAVVLLAMKKSPQQQRIAVAPPEPVPTRQSAVVVTNVVTKVVKPSTAKQDAAKQPMQALPTKSFDLGKGIKMEFVECPAGTFVMGAGSKLWNSECVLRGGNRRDNSNMLYPRKVTISRPFWMAKYPVTAKQWESLMGKHNYKGVAADMEKALGPNAAEQKRYLERQDFLSVISQKLKGQIPNGYVARLPTAAEMEYAFRSGGKDSGDLYSRVFSDGEKISDDELKKVVLSGKVLMEQLQGQGIGLTMDNVYSARSERTYVALRNAPSFGGAVGVHVANAWGIHDMFMESCCADRSASSREHTSCGDFLDEETDPFVNEVTSRSTLFAPLCKPPWMFKIAIATAIRIVIGPDLVKERGESNGKVYASKVGEYIWSYYLEGEEAVISRVPRNEAAICGAAICGAAIRPLPSGRIEVPAMLDGRKVVAIGNQAFADCAELTEVVIPEGIRELRGYGAFGGCLSLKSVQLPRSLEAIVGWRVFIRCNKLQELDIRQCRRVNGLAIRNRNLRIRCDSDNPWMSIDDNGAIYNRDRTVLMRWPIESAQLNLPESVKVIAEGACIDCKFQTLHLPDGVVEIERLSYRCCRRLKEVLLPKSVRKLGSGVFEDCESLRRVVLEGDAPMCDDADDAWKSAFGKTSDDLVVYVKRGSKGWRADGGEGLPELWPENQAVKRKIRYIDELPAAKQEVAKQEIAIPPMQSRPTKTFDIGKGVKMEFVECPAGTFMMGRPGDKDRTSGYYEHQVTITRPFWMMKIPVTEEIHQTLFGPRELEAGEKAMGPKMMHYYSIKEYYELFKDRGILPETCERLTKKFRSELPRGYVFRLPTEAEWEYAYRAGCKDADDIYYSPWPESLYGSINAKWLNTIWRSRDTLELLAGKGVGEYQDRGEITVRSVNGGAVMYGLAGRKRPNAWGIYDMRMPVLFLERFDSKNVVQIMSNLEGEKRHWAAWANFNREYGLISYQDSESDPVASYADVNAAERCYSFAYFSGYNGKRPYKGCHQHNVTLRLVIGPDLIKERRMDKGKGANAAKTLAAEDKASSFTPAQLKRMQDKDGWSAMRKATETMFKGWRVCSKQQAKFPKYLRKNNTGESALGYLAEYKGVKDVLRTYGDGDVLERPSSVPIRPGQRLRFRACGENGVTIMAEVDGAKTFCDGHALNGTDWEEFDIDLSKLAGKKATITLNVAGRSSGQSTVQWHGIEVK